MNTVRFLCSALSAAITSCARIGKTCPLMATEVPVCDGSAKELEHGDCAALQIARQPR